MKIFISACVYALMASGLVYGNGDVDERESVGGIVLGYSGEIPEDLAIRVRAFIEYHTAIPVRLTPVEMGDGESLREIGEPLNKILEPDDVFLVVFAWPDTGHEANEEHAAYLYDHEVAVINARVLEDTDDLETYGRRLEKVAMHSVGIMLGVEPVPNPRSAMFPYRTIEQLDMMGRNYDPPSLHNVQRAASKRGIDLMEDKTRIPDRP